MCKERICPICNKSLPKDAHPRQVYCSEQCHKEKRHEIDRTRREYYKSKGICVHCGQAPAKPGSTYCAMCILNFRDYVAIRRERWREKDVCHICGKPKGTNNSVCDDCASKQKVRQKRVYAQRIDSGLCGICGKRKATVGYKSCAFCRDRYSQNQNKKVA